MTSSIQEGESDLRDGSLGGPRGGSAVGRDHSQIERGQAAKAGMRAGCHRGVDENSVQEVSERKGSHQRAEEGPSEAATVAGCQYAGSAVEVSFGDMADL